MACVTCSGARLMRAHFRLARVRLLKMAGPREGERDVQGHLREGRADRAHHAQPARGHERHRRRRAGRTRRMRCEGERRRRGPRHRALGSRRGVLRRLRSDRLRARQRRHGRNPGDALGSDEGLRLHDAQHRAVHELVALLPAGDLARCMATRSPADRISRSAPTSSS